MLIFLKEVASCLKIHFTYNRYYCVTCVLSKRDKFSLKNIGKRVAPGNGRRKPPSYKKLGGSREYPVSWFQLGSSGNGSFDQQARSRHQSMIENALQTSIESLLWSSDIDGLADCPIEITQVELSSNFHSATVYWKLDEWKGNWSEDLNLKSVKVGKQKAIHIIRQVFGFQYVNDMVKRLKNNMFSIIIDEATDRGSKKQLAVLATYFDIACVPDPNTGKGS
eukprot:gene18550-20413_t